MGKMYYTILAGNQVIAHDVEAEIVPILVKGLLNEWFSDYGLCLTVQAQEKPYHVESCKPNVEC